MKKWKKISIHHYIWLNTRRYRTISCGKPKQKTAMSGVKISWKIRCQWYWMPGVFVVPVNPRNLNVISTDTRICYFVRFSFVCCFEIATNPINSISEKATLLWYFECNCYIGFDMIWYVIWYIKLLLGCHTLAVVQYTFTHKQYTEQHNSLRASNT